MFARIFVCDLPPPERNANIYMAGLQQEAKALEHVDWHRCAPICMSNYDS